MAALETALSLREEAGGTVSVVTMGPPQSEEALREALAAGADSALLLTDKDFAGGDTLATSTVLGAAIARMKPSPELVLCGMHTIDSDTGHVGPQIAEQLGIPQVCGVNEVRLGNDCLLVERSGDGFLDMIKLRIPALITVAQDASRVVDIPLGALEKAFSTGRVETAGRRELGLEVDTVGLKGSATMVSSLRTPPPKKNSGKPHSGAPEDLCEILIKTLETLNIIDEADDKEQ
jgi:electron transfer flavoprotein beta subunit